MSDSYPNNVINTKIWREEAEPDNAFATRAAFCRGYDVFGEMIGKTRWVEMLLLLFRDDLPPASLIEMLEALAVALANPGPRDQSIHAAMSGGVAGSTAAASLMAALAVGAGRQGGAREVFDAMTWWTACGTDTAAWRDRVENSPPELVEIWPAGEHPPGFDPHGVSTPTVVRQLLVSLAGIGASPRLAWLVEHRPELEQITGMPLALCGVAAAALSDLGFTPQEGEMLFLLLRLPGAAAHALEQGAYGYKRFPFPPVELADDPVPQEAR